MSRPIFARINKQRSDGDNRRSRRHEGTDEMTKPIPDKAEVALEYPDKLYIGTFERTARFDAHFDENGVSLVLRREGDGATRKSVHMHFHHALFAEILSDLARSVSAIPSDDAAHREALSDGALALYRSFDISPADRPSATAGIPGNRRDDTNGVGNMTPAEEVLLLHVME